MFDKFRSRDTEILDKKKINDERLRELDHLNSINIQEKIIKDQRQKIYKELLDDQMKYKFTSHSPIHGRNNIHNEEENINQGYQNNLVLTPYKKAEIVPNPCKIFFKNDKDKVNNYSLGYTILDHNPILNPVHNYRYNRYLYNSNGLGNSSFQNLGSQIIK
jgi:hypothetical protein